VITIIERITFERFVGTYTEDQSEVGVVIEIAEDQNASRRIWLTLLVSRVQAPMTC
jgi:hypothetical protein